MDSASFDAATLFAGGRLCLDFVNTSCQRRGVPLEFLGSGEELRRWLLLAENATGTSLCPDEGLWNAGYWDRVLPRAIGLRTALDDLFRGIIGAGPVPAAALEVVNAVLRENPVYSQIENGGDGFRESVVVCRPGDRWLVAIAQDAVDLLCHSDLSLLRQCECPTCVRVFYDTTKNHKRRWCVEKCGSKPKAAAYYRRKVAAKAAQSGRTE